MNLIEIAQKVAYSAGITPPDALAGSDVRESQELLSFANQVGDELARRVDWGQLTKTEAVPGDGTSSSVIIANDVSRITRGIGVKHNGSIVRPLTRAEWNNLQQVEGSPRYFLLEDKGLSLWPYLAAGDAVMVTYQSKNWCNNGSNKFNADTDETLLDDDLTEKGLAARWRREKGMPFVDYEAEFEEAIGQLAQFNDRARF